MSERFRYQSGERLPVEVLVFEVEPEHVDEFIAVDHEVWTLGEADTDGIGHIPFLSKEVWIDDAHPGRIILTFVWESIESWQHVGDEHLQRELQARFDEPLLTTEQALEFIEALAEQRSWGMGELLRIIPPEETLTAVRTAVEKAIAHIPAQVAVGDDPLQDSVSIDDTKAAKSLFRHHHNRFGHHRVGAGERKGCFAMHEIVHEF